MWDLIVSVPDHCLSFYFKAIICKKSVQKKILQSVIVHLTSRADNALHQRNK